MDEQGYRADARARGFEEPVAKTWDAGLVNDTHTHDADLFLLIRAGEMVVECGGGSRLCRPGDTILVAGREPHVERVGPAGVTFLVARRPVPAGAS